MERFYPAYYQNFRCLAGDCPDSCCHEWEVQIDPETAAQYRAMEGDLGEALRNCLYDEDGETYLRNRGGRCPMWRDDGLCRIQAEEGHGALSQVCQQFPRLRHEYGDFEELGLEMSCPEAARLILGTAEQAWCRETVSGGEMPEYDDLDMNILKVTRTEALTLLSDKTLTPGEALAVLLLYGYAAQEMLDAGELYDFDREKALENGRRFAQTGDFESVLDFFRGLEILTERWRVLLARGEEKRFWQEEDRRFARYLVERYWLQAVSDYDLVGRVKLAVVSCVMIRCLGGLPAETAQLYSKEIENASENVEAILDGAYTARGLTDRNLLGLLLN